MSELSISIQNVGGIERFDTDIEEGVTLIAGGNASNKTSFLRAVAFAIGSDDVPIRTGADEARVELTVDGTTVERTARRRGVGIQTEGEPLLSDPNDREKFTSVAMLHEFNPLRVAIRQGNNVEDPLKSPVDFEDLERQRSNLLDRKRRLERQLDDLSDVEQTLDRRNEELATKEQRRQELEEEIEELEDSHTPTDVSEELEALQDERRTLLDEKQRTRDRIDSIEDAIDRQEEELEEIEGDIDALESELDGVRIDDLKAERNRLLSEIDEVNERIDVLQSVLTTNREVLQSDQVGILGVSHELTDDVITCWACGQEAERSDVEQTVDRLEELIRKDKSKKQEYEPDIADLEAEIEAVRKKEAELDRLRRKRRETEEAISDRRSSKAENEQRLEELEASLDETLAELEDAKEQNRSDDSEILDQLEDRRIKLQTVKHEIGRLEEECDSLETDLAERERMSEELETVSREIEELTEQIQNLEQDLRTRFNGAMDELIGILDLDNIERIWLDGNFELVVAREIDGSVQEDTVRNLSEGERELIGLVLGLAGQKAYDLPDSISVLLLDSLGALDGDRTEQLVEYFGDELDYVIAAVHPDVSTAIAQDQATTNDPTVVPT